MKYNISKIESGNEVKLGTKIVLRNNSEKIYLKEIGKGFTFAKCGFDNFLLYDDFAAQISPCTERQIKIMEISWRKYYEIKIKHKSSLLSIGHGIYDSLNYTKYEYIGDDNTLILKTKVGTGIFRNNNWVLPPEFSRIERVSDMYILQKSDKMGMVKIKESNTIWLLPLKYNNLDVIDSWESLIRVSQGRKSGLYKTDTWLSPLKYGTIEVIKSDSGLMLISQRGKYGLYDCYENSFVLHVKFDEIKKLTHLKGHRSDKGSGDIPVFLVRKGDKYGLFIDRDWLFKPLFNKIKWLSKEYFLLRDKHAIIVVKRKKNVIKFSPQTFITTDNNSLTILAGEHSERITISC